MKFRFQLLVKLANNTVDAMFLALNTVFLAPNSVFLAPAYTLPDYSGSAEDSLGLGTYLDSQFPAQIHNFGW
jgi:hypothetical protein